VAITRHSDYSNYDSILNSNTKIGIQNHNVEKLTIPSGFPLPVGSASIPSQRSSGRGLSRIERKYLYEKNDPVGTPDALV
jgi:hypothetical protein